MDLRGRLAFRKDHHELMTAESLRAKELLKKERAQELVNLEKSAMAAATHLGTMIPVRTTFAQLPRTGAVFPLRLYRKGSR